MRLLLAVDDPVRLTEGLSREGHRIVGAVPADLPARSAAEDAPRGEAEQALARMRDSDAVVLEVRRDTLTTALVAICDRAGTRILPLCATDADRRLAAAFGLEEPQHHEIEPWRLSVVLAAAPTRAAGVRPARALPRVITVWGPPGAPGRTTVAIELAVELARGDRHVGLVDADTHAPSIAIALGLADEGPGFAAACRQAEFGGLDPRELTRVSSPLGRTGVDVLTGINRPSRWPELTESRVENALAVCRQWADFVVVDVAASVERDEEIVSDLEGPRRNAATIAALRSADLVVAVAGADPVGISRFLRAHSELRATVGATPIVVLANRLRAGTLGLDPRGQIRRALDRFGGIGDVWFLPPDGRSADSAILSAQPISEVAPRSPIVLAMRRFVGEAVVPVAAAPPSRRQRRGGRRKARVPGV